MSNETHAPGALVQQTVNEYQLGEVLSSLALGVVYDAVNTSTQARVHFHQLRTPSGEPPPPDRFKHAMFSFKGIESPHLTQLDGFGRDDSRALSYVVYQAEGLRPLRASELFGPGGALAHGVEAVNQAQRWTANLLDALKAIHAKRATHLALSPDVLWLDQAGQLLLSQQGVAIAFKRRVSSKLSPDALTDDPTLLARASYVSPEEVKGRLTQPIADLYSVACILCEWLTGAPPFQGATSEETLGLHLTCPPLESPVIRALPPSLQTFFERALAKESRGRFSAAHELLSGLTTALETWRSTDQPTPVPEAHAVESDAQSEPQEDDEGGLSTLFEPDDEGGVDTSAELPAPGLDEPEGAPSQGERDLAGDERRAEEDELLRTTPVPSVEPSLPDEGERGDIEEELAFGGADELAFGGAGDLAFGGADDLGFSQSQSDERTFLEFSDVDDQTVFEANIEDEIEEVHKSSVLDSPPISAAQRISASLDRVGPPAPSPIPSPIPSPTPAPTPAFVATTPANMIAGAPSPAPNQAQQGAGSAPSFRTEAFSSMSYEGGTPPPATQPTFTPPVPMQTLGYGTNLSASEVESHLKASSDEIAELEIEEALVDELDPSRVMPLPSLSPHGLAQPKDDFGLEGMADLSSIRPLQSPQPQIPSPPLGTEAPSPFATPAHQSAPVSPTPSPFAQPPSSPFATPVGPATPAPPASIAPPVTPGPASAPPAQARGGSKAKLLISLTMILTLIGGGAWAVMTGLVDLSALSLGGGPVSLNISTQPEGQTQVGLFIQNSIRASVPYEYQYTQGEQVGEETPVRFVWGTSLIKTRVPVFEGNTWVRLLIAPPLGVTQQSQVERVVVTSNISEALVSVGLAPIGHTPLVLFGARGQSLELIIEAPGQEEVLKVTFGETKSVEATFDVAQ